MRKQISICILLSIIVILLSLIFIKINNTTKEYNKQQELLNTQRVEQKEESIRISQPYTQYMFYIVNEDGQLVVYDTKTEELYMETGIKAKDLPTELQQQLSEGIFFHTESDLYDFLEKVCFLLLFLLFPLLYQAHNILLYTE